MRRSAILFLMLLLWAPSGDALWRPVDSWTIPGSGPDVASIGEDHLLVWSEDSEALDRQVFWEVIGIDDRSVVPGERGSFRCWGTPLIAAGPDRFLVACFDPLAHQELALQLVSRHGIAIGEPIRIPGPVAEGAVAWDGSAFTVVVVDGREHLQLMRLSLSGNVIDPLHPLVPSIEAPEGYRSSQVRPRLIPVEDRLLLLWQEGEDQFTCMITCPVPGRPGIIRGRYLELGAIVPEPQLLIEDPVAALAPEATWNGEEIALVWFSQVARERYPADLHVAMLNEDLDVLRSRRHEGLSATVGWLPMPLSQIQWMGQELRLVWEGPAPLENGRVGPRELMVTTIEPLSLDLDPRRLVTGFDDYSRPGMVPVDESAFLLVHERYQSGSWDVVVTLYHWIEPNRRRAVRR